MNKIVMLSLFLVMLVSFYVVATQQVPFKRYSCQSVVGRQAPSFTAPALVDGKETTISLADFEGKYKVLVFYPADFSFVCPTELWALQEKIAQFKEKNAVVLAISIDQLPTHKAWLDTPSDKGGIKGISFPLLTDIYKDICASYGVLDDSGVAKRGLFILDEQNIVQAALINNTKIGRNIDEALRLLDAAQFTAQHEDVCPANWQDGEQTFEPTVKGVKEYAQKKNSSNQSKEN